MFILIFNLLSLAFAPADSLNFYSSFGNFQEAVSVSTCREQFVYVSDAGTNQIYKYTAQGQLLLNSGGTGSGNNQFNYPQAIDASNGLDVYVCDYQNNRIQRLDLNLNYIATFDFNLYNKTADNSKKIFRPYGIAYLTTSDIFVLADATSYRVVKLKSLDEVSLLFGSNSFGYDKLDDPKKIVRGANLDMWVLDKGRDEFVNFDSYGTLVDRINNPGKNKLISIAFYRNKLYLLNDKNLLLYDLTSHQFTGMFSYTLYGNPEVKDITVLNENKVLLLTKEKVYVFQLTKS